MAAPETRLTPREPAGAEAVKASAKRIAPRLKALAPEAEQSRRLTRERIDLVRDHGLFKILQPERTGGHQLTLRTHLDIVSALSEGCVSTGWVTVTGQVIPAQLIRHDEKNVSWVRPKKTPLVNPARTELKALTVQILARPCVRSAIRSSGSSRPMCTRSMNGFSVHCTRSRATGIWLNAIRLS